MTTTNSAPATDVPCTPLGVKALAILLTALEPTYARNWSILFAAYSEKSVRRKLEELIARGYLANVPVQTPHRNLLESWLTDKGRRTLESTRMRA